MQLLVSVSTPRDAEAASLGGADVIDAKDPWSGALGAVAAGDLHAICAAVGTDRTVSAALGEVTDARGAYRAAHAATAAGVAFVKIGFAPGMPLEHVALCTAAARYAARGAGSAGVVAVAFADRPDWPPDAFLDVVAGAGAAGVLLDTADKDGPGLRLVLPGERVARWVEAAHGRGLFAAVAGRLTADDLWFVRADGADIAGVRGAACVGGRTGIVDAHRVRALRAVLDGTRPVGVDGPGDALDGMAPFTPASPISS